MKNSFLEGFLFRPQGEPMKYPVTFAAKISQYPIRYIWREAWHFRYLCYTTILVFPLLWKVDKKLTGPENKAYWREKRARDHHEFQEALKKKWEVRT